MSFFFACNGHMRRTFSLNKLAFATFVGFIKKQSIVFPSNIETLVKELNYAKDLKGPFFCNESCLSFWNEFVMISTFFGKRLKTAISAISAVYTVVLAVLREQSHAILRQQTHAILRERTAQANALDDTHLAHCKGGCQLTNSLEKQKVNPTTLQ